MNDNMEKLWGWAPMSYNLGLLGRVSNYLSIRSKLFWAFHSGILRVCSLNNNPSINGVFSTDNVPEFYIYLLKFSS